MKLRAATLYSVLCTLCLLTLGVSAAQAGVTASVRVVSVQVNEDLDGVCGGADLRVNLDIDVDSGQGPENLSIHSCDDICSTSPTFSKLLQTRAVDPGVGDIGIRFDLFDADSFPCDFIPEDDPISDQTMAFPMGATQSFFREQVGIGVKVIYQVDVVRDCGSAGDIPGDGEDNDCDGLIDECEPLPCVFSGTRPECQNVAGHQACNPDGSLAACAPDNLSDEDPPNDGVDDNCDGVVCVTGGPCVHQGTTRGCERAPGVASCAAPQDDFPIACPFDAASGLPPQVPDPNNGFVDIVDDNCDGFAELDPSDSSKGEELCDGIDNDGNGAIDDASGSCLVKVLVIPLCLENPEDPATNEWFKEKVAAARAAFVEALGMDACAGTVQFEALLPSIKNFDCDPDWLVNTSPNADTNAPLAVGRVELDDWIAADPVARHKFRPYQYDAVMMLTQTDLFGDVAAGGTNTSGDFWAEQLPGQDSGFLVNGTEIEFAWSIVPAHEFGHIMGLEEEYCSAIIEDPSSDAATACNGAIPVPNPLSANFGCDPKSPTCCSVGFRLDSISFDHDNTPCAGQQQGCCLGNSAVEDPSLPQSQWQLDPVGRCVMANVSRAKPRHFCPACLHHIRTSAPLSVQCGTVFDGQDRLLLVNGQASPGPGVLVSLDVHGVRYVTGRGGWQAIPPEPNGEVLLHFTAQGGAIPLATRAFQVPHVNVGDRSVVEGSAQLRIPLPDEVSEEEPVTVFVEHDGVIVNQVTINGEPPFIDITDARAECQGPFGAMVTLDASGTEDPDGDPVTLAWEVPPEISLDLSVSNRARGVFPLGTTGVWVTATDSAGLTDEAYVEVTVEDTVPPVFDLPTLPSISATTCASSVGDVTIVPPRATDLCSTPEVMGSVAGLTIDGPTNLLIRPGVHTITWTATDGVQASDKAQGLTVLPAMFAGRALDLRDNSKVKAGTLFASLGNAGTSYTRVGGSATKSGSLYSRASVESFGGTIDGNLFTHGTYTPHNGALVTGTVTQGQPVGLPGLPAGVTTPVSGPTVTVTSSTIVLSPGTYGAVTINSGAPVPALRLSAAGTYRFASLTSNAASKIQVDAAPGQRVNVLVSSSLNYRGPFAYADGNLAPVFLGFGGASAVIEGPFRGTMVAPNSAIELGLNASSDIRGQFATKDLVIRANTTVKCEPSSVLGNTFTVQ